MNKYIYYTLILSLIVAPSVKAAQNVHLQLEGETQGDTAELELREVQTDPIGNEGVEPDEIDAQNNSATPGVEPDEIDVNLRDPHTEEYDVEPRTTTADKEHKDWINLDSVQYSGDDEEQVMNKKEMAEKLAAPAATKPAGSQVASSQPKVLIVAPAASGMDESGEFWFEVNQIMYTRGGYVKLGDIKGNSSPYETEGGNAETTWKVEKGEKAAGKKAREIVVVGSKASDKASPKLQEANCNGTEFVCKPENAVTPDGLTDYAARVANSFESVKEVKMSDTAVEVLGTQPFKLFWFIPMTIDHTTEVSTDPVSFGRVKVSYPWYHFLGIKTVQADDIQTVVDGAAISSWKVTEMDGKSENMEQEQQVRDDTEDSEQAETDGGTVQTEIISMNLSEASAQILHTVTSYIAQYNESDLEFLRR